MQASEVVIVVAVARSPLIELGGAAVEMAQDCLLVSLTRMSRRSGGFDHEMWRCGDTGTGRSPSETALKHFTVSACTSTLWQDHLPLKLRLEVGGKIYDANSERRLP